MKHQRLATVISLARTMAKSDITLAAQYLRGQGDPGYSKVQRLAEYFEQQKAA